MPQPALTKAERYRQLAQRCRQDPLWFFESFLKIQDNLGRVVPFKPRYSQRRVIQVIQDLRRQGKPVRLIILKARRVGLSTLTAAYLFWRARWFPNSTCRIVADRDESAKGVFAMAKLFYDNLPSEIRPLKRLENRNQILFENPNPKTRDQDPGLRSEIQFQIAGKTTGRDEEVARGEAGRGLRIHAIHCTETAYWPDPENTFTALLNAVPDADLDSIVVLESTARMAGDYFYTEWFKAERGESPFVPIFIPWHQIPDGEMDPPLGPPADGGPTVIAHLTEEEGRELYVDLRDDEKRLIESHAAGDTFEELMRTDTVTVTLHKLAWRRYVIPNKCQGQVAIFNQQYPSDPQTAFLSSGISIFSQAALHFYFQKTLDGRRGDLAKGMNGKVIFTPNPQGSLEVYKPPIKGEGYGIGADSSLGLENSDLSAAEVLSRRRMEQVAELICTQMEPDDFARYLVLLGLWYNEAWLFPELAQLGGGGGYALMKAILELRYPRLGYTREWHKPGQRFTSTAGFAVNAQTVSVLTTVLTQTVWRGAGLTKETPQSLRTNPRLRLYSKRLLAQMAGFVLDRRGRPGARKGEKDDAVRALGLAILLMEQLPDVKELGSAHGILGGSRAPHDVRGVSLEVTGQAGVPEWYVT